MILILFLTPLLLFADERGGLLQPTLLEDMTPPSKSEDGIKSGSINLAFSYGIHTVEYYESLSKNLTDELNATDNDLIIVKDFINSIALIVSKIITKGNSRKVLSKEGLEVFSKFYSKMEPLIKTYLKPDSIFWSIEAPSDKSIGFDLLMLQTSIQSLQDFILFKRDNINSEIKASTSNLAISIAVFKDIKKLMSNTIYQITRN